MALPRRLNRPDFEGEKRFISLNQDQIPKSEIQRLSEHLPIKLSESARSEFLAGVVQSIQMYKTLKRNETEAKQRDQLRCVAEKARELMHAMAKISPDSWSEIYAISQEFVFDETAPAQLHEPTKKAIFEREPLPHMWDTVQDVESIFSHAEEQFKPNKQSRPSINNARAFVAEIAKMHFQLTGSWPAYSKASRFPLLIEEAGQIATLGHIGRDTVESVIRALKPQYPV